MKPTSPVASPAARDAERPAAPLPVLFFTPRLGTGGAEMHLLRLLNHFDRRRIRPLLAVAKPGGNYESMLREDVPITYLTRGRIRSATLNMLSALGPLRRHIESTRPALVVGVLDPAIAALHHAVRRQPAATRPKLVACVQNNFAAESRDRKLAAKLFQGAIVRGYRHADRVIALSQGVADDLQVQIPAVAGKTQVIYNAAFDDSIVQKSQLPCPEPKPDGVPVLVSCGRFARQKGYPWLLQAIDRVRRQRPVELWMLGEGPEREATQRLAAELDLGSVVKFLGFQKNPFPYFRQADLFVLSSLYEGFGNVLVEAMSCGAPVLSTRCPFGPEEIIADGQTGFLVPPADADALARGILDALADPVRLQTIASAGRSRAADFASQTIADQYAQALWEVGR